MRTVSIPEASDHEALAARVAHLEDMLAACVKDLQTVRTAAIDPDLTPREVARMLRMASDKVYAAIKSGELPAQLRPGRGGMAYRVRRSDAEAWRRSLAGPIAPEATQRRTA